MEDKKAMKELSFKEYSNQILSQIRDTKNIVLATCANNHATTRLVGHLIQGNTILFSTGSGSYKVEQIRQNPQVAFFLDGLNIEAIASVYGHPDKLPAFRSEYETKYPEYVNAYGFNLDAVVVAANIQKVQIYNYESGAGKIIIDFIEERAYRIEL